MRCVGAIALAWALCLLLLPGAARAQEEGGGPDAALVRVGEAQMQEVQHQRLIMGQILPARRSMLTAEQSGRVVQAPPVSGIAVKEGEVLARLDTTLLESDRAAARATVNEAEAQVAERQAMLDLSTRNRERLEGLVKSSVAREKELKDARDDEAAAAARLRLAEARLERNKAELRHLEQRIQKTEVRAPFDGYVVRKETELGQWINPGDPVAEVVETVRVKVQLDVPESMIQHIPRDEPIRLRFQALNITREAPVFRIVPDGDRQARTFRTWIRLKNPDGRLKPGMTVSAELPTGRMTEAMTVPKDSVQMTPNGAVVYANRGGKAMRIGVQIRFGTRDRFVVDAADLRAGDRVVVEGNERLRPGQPLKIVSPDDPTTEEESGTASRADAAP